MGDEKILDPTSHPLVAPPAHSIAKLYDLQWDEDKKDYMLYHDPNTGELEGTQYLVPKSKEDLKKERPYAPGNGRKQLMDLWAVQQTL